jgi:hypothetical protein
MHIVMEKAAQVAGRAKRYGPYRYLAVVELDPQWTADHPDEEPKMISERARGVKRIVHVSPGLWAGGKTMRSEYHQVKAMMHALADKLNARVNDEEWSTSEQRKLAMKRREDPMPRPGVWPHQS